MLSKKNRLAAEKDYSKLFAKGKSVSGRGVGMKFARNTVGKTRIGFVVSTKISKRAVIRNSIKRKMREIMRAELPLLKDSSLDISFIARSESSKMSFQELRQAILYLLDKSGTIKRPVS